MQLLHSFRSLYFNKVSIFLRSEVNILNGAKDFEILTQIQFWNIYRSNFNIPIKESFTNLGEHFDFQS